MDKPVKKMEPQMDAPGNLMAMKEDDKGDVLAQSECKYCKPQGAEAAAHDPSTCPYCQRMEKEDAGSNCPYCAAMKQGGQDTDTQCRYCVEMTAGPDVMNPTTTDSENFAGQDLNPPDMPKPILGEDGPIPQGISTPDNPTVNNLMLDPVAPSVAALDPNAAGPKEGVQLDQSKEAMIAIATEIETGQPQTPAMQQQQAISAQAPAMEQVDSAQQAVGTEMEGNVSRPGGYDANVPGDMGLSDGADTTDAGPDLSQVLQGGLDSQADQIKREKVIQMVSQALEGFKASKKIIERAQEQAPQLYQSSIMMLKAMIEMARMLGLDSEGAPTANPLEPQGQGGEWQDPFPKHPDQGGPALAPGHAAPEGQAPAGAAPAQGGEWANPFPVHSENGGSEGGIGQGVGKLPTSATTPHVARTPQAPGAINDKGQKKVIDPATGDVRWIDMKQGRVQSPTGVPVKPS